MKTYPTFEGNRHWTWT